MNTALWSTLLAVHWPELCARLGPRLDDFLGAAVQKAALHRLQLEAAVARYVNLCFALGPNFEDRAENEWALALLSNDALDDWVRMHQLVVRACGELQRLPGEGARAVAQLQRSDAALMDAHDALPRHPDAGPLSRVACDLEMLDIGLLDLDWRHEYTCLKGHWTRTPVAQPARGLRIHAGQPLPSQVTVLSHAPGAGPVARIQVRQHMHACCNQDQHPALDLTGPHGLAHWQGHAATALSWDAQAQAATPAPYGLGALLLEETQACISLLHAQCCGLRDTGMPAGALQTWLWCYRAEQYLMAFARATPLEAQWPRAQQAAPACAASSMAYERDGMPLPTHAWLQGLDQALPQQLLQGLDRLFAHWSAGTQNPAMRASVGLMQGHAALTWGWRESAQGLAEPAWMRVAGEIELAHQFDLELSGELTLGVTRTRMRLSLKGTLPWACSLQREDAQTELMQTLLGAGARGQLAFQIAFDPIAVEEGAMVSSMAGCTGQLGLECGLRPRSQGGGGRQFFVRMHTTPVAVAVAVHDPVLGQLRKSLALLPATPLLDWSLG